MRKEEFFKLLKTRLAVIEENELEDILSEYRQHIDMKMQSGVSEEEAIKDFGDVDVLAGDILESYHVRSDYDAKKENKETLKEIKEKSESFFGKMSSAFKKGFSSFGSFFKKSFAKFKSLFKRKKKEPAASQKKEKYNLWNDIKQSAKAFWDAVILLIKWLIRFCLNAALIFTGTVTALFAGITILAFGFCVVLLTGGYPAVGITLTLLGLSAVLASLTVLAFVSAKGKKNSTEPQKEELNCDKA